VEQVNPSRLEHRYDPPLLVDRAGGRHYVDPARTYPRPDVTEVGAVLTVVTNADGSPRLEWRPGVSQAMLVGIVADPATEPHEHTWADLTALLGTLPSGSYLIVKAPLDPANLPPGITAQTSLTLGDWIVAVDGDGDGTSDVWHHVAMPTATGGLVTVISGRDGTAVNAGWTPDNFQPPPARTLGHVVFNETTHRTWVYDGTTWQTLLPPARPGQTGQMVVQVSAGGDITIGPDLFTHMIVDPAHWLGGVELRSTELTNDGAFPPGSWAEVAEEYGVDITGAASKGVPDGHYPFGTLFRKRADGRIVTHRPADPFALPPVGPTDDGKALTVLDANAGTIGWAEPVEAIRGVIAHTSHVGDNVFRWTNLVATVTNPFTAYGMHPHTYLYVAEAVASIPAGVPGIAGLTAFVGDLVAIVDSDNDGVADTFQLLSAGPPGASERPAVTVSTVAGETPLPPTTGATGGTPVAWSIAEFYAFVAAGATTIVHVTLPTSTAAGELSLVNVVGGNTIVLWIESIPASMYPLFQSHQSHVSQVLANHADLEADEIGVEYVAGTRRLSLAYDTGVIVGHTLDQTSAQKITSAATLPGVSGLRDDVWLNTTEQTAFIHDGSAWVKWPAGGSRTAVANHETAVTGGTTAYWNGLPVGSLVYCRDTTALLVKSALPATWEKIGHTVPLPNSAPAGALLEVRPGAAGGFAWVTHKLPEVVVSISRAAPNGYTETINLDQHGEITFTGSSIGQSFLIGVKGGSTAGEMKAVWKNATTPASLNNWDASIPASSGAPGLLLFNRIDDFTVITFDIDLHRLPDGRHIGQIEIITSAHQWLKATLLLPASATGLIFGSYAHESGHIEIEGVAYP